MASRVEARGSAKELRKQLSTLENEVARLKREEQQLIKEISAAEEIDEVDKEKSRLLSILTAHRLHGLTVLDETEDKIEIRLDPNYNGSYEDQYVFELQKSDNRWSVVKHNLPYFMPLASKINNTKRKNPKKIIDMCHEYLKSYACRKGQVMEAREKFPQLMIEWTATYNFISIYFDSGTLKDVKVGLKYGDYDELPIETQFTVKGAQPQGRALKSIEQLVALFDRKYISGAINAAIPHN